MLVGNENIVKSQKVHTAISVLACLIWPFMFIGTVSYLSTFFFLAFLAMLCRVYISKNSFSLTKLEYWYSWGLSAIISLAWVISDYSIFLVSKIGYIKSLIAFLCGWHGLYLIVRGIFIFLNCNASKIITSNDVEKKVQVKYRLLALGLPIVVDGIYLFSSGYPGWVSVDTADQINQMVTGTYQNHHPFWHTKLMESILKPVYIITNDGDVAIAAFCIFQIVIMAMVFTYLIDTLLKMNIRGRIIIGIILLQAFAPYNIAMSCALIKDTAFSIMTLLLSICVFRELTEIGNRIANRCILVIGVVGSCLFRTNGMIVVAILLLLSLMLLKKDRNCRAYLWIIGLCFTVSFLLNNIYLKVIDIPQPDTVESLSIPLQQIARASYEGRKLNSNQAEYIESIVSYERMGEVYNTYISDNVKNLIRNEGNQDLIAEDKILFIKMWISIGVSNPVAYVKSWIDETRGYWCPSYYYSTWQNGMSERVDLSAYNVHVEKSESFIKKIWDSWSALWNLNQIPVLEILIASGLWFWTIVAVAIYSIINKKKYMIICVLPIAIVLTLCIATPVANMFRYVYALYLCLPLVVVAAFYKKE